MKKSDPDIAQQLPYNEQALLRWHLLFDGIHTGGASLSTSCCLFDEPYKTLPDLHWLARWSAGSLWSFNLGLLG
jgi:hypothetical protein